ncbi:DUF2563 family protein [uncultured Mycobacterium sp.]|uniref:DUF2563 family protein n=1 Tax=uncultured Mycobacterium sp. TaxID=171292 RepID=UPI0035CA3A2A
MFVDSGMLHSWPSESHRAGGHPYDGANDLGRVSLSAKIFCAFDPAGAFQERVSAAHACHVLTLQGRREILGNVDSEANHAAALFTEMESHNAKALRDVRCSYRT